MLVYLVCFLCAQSKLDLDECRRMIEERVRLIKSQPKENTGIPSSLDMKPSAEKTESSESVSLPDKNVSSDLDTIISNYTSFFKEEKSYFCVLENYDIILMKLFKRFKSRQSGLVDITLNQLIDMLINLRKLLKDYESKTLMSHYTEEEVKETLKFIRKKILKQVMDKYCIKNASSEFKETFEKSLITLLFELKTAFNSNDNNYSQCIKKIEDMICEIDKESGHVYLSYRSPYHDKPQDLHEKDYKNQIELLNNENERVNQENLYLKRAIDIYEKNILELRKSIDDFAKELRNKDLVVETLKNEFSSAEKEISILKEEKEKSDLILTPMEEFITQFDEIKEKLKKKDEEIIKTREEVIALTKGNEQLNALLSDSEEKIKITLQKTEEENKKRISELLAQLSQREKDLNNLQKEFEYFKAINPPKKETSEEKEGPTIVSVDKNEELLASERKKEDKEAVSEVNPSN
ncbi:hypothetical protein TUBRATIS_009260 [Tubulinosema ratisbonensis]|uniref:Uncharacterized protein n=1 Tax=Tubulinosema ratisbonensis TaxID=291195 RepID=A0A437AN17_9MICR|nr:hypothetical protein TUBRATIS_009260 [Tubulinosema ratisbonensis]